MVQACCRVLGSAARLLRWRPCRHALLPLQCLFMSTVNLFADKSAKEA